MYPILFRTVQKRDELPPNWTNVSDVSSDLHLCVIGYQECEDSPPLVVTSSLVINGSQQTWQVHIHGHKLDPSVISNLADIPNNLDVNTASILLNRLSELKICAGNPEPKFISLGRTKKNSQFLSPDSEVMAFLDNNACVSANGLEYPITVRCSKCHLLTDEVGCPVCTKYRKNLVAQEARITKQTCMLQKSSKTNYR